MHWLTYMCTRICDIPIQISHTHTHTHTQVHEALVALSPWAVVRMGAEEWSVDLPRGRRLNLAISALGAISNAYFQGVHMYLCPLSQSKSQTKPYLAKPCCASLRPQIPSLVLSFRVVPFTTYFTTMLSSCIACCVCVCVCIIPLFHLLTCVFMLNCVHLHTTSLVSVFIC